VVGRHSRNHRDDDIFGVFDHEVELNEGEQEQHKDDPAGLAVDYVPDDEA
jgi:hypothetical protein